MKVPEIRIDVVNRKPVHDDGAYVLYWMAAFRRTRWNYSLDRAIEWARELGKPLIVLEDLRCGNRWDCDRFHRFVLDGTEDNARRLQRRGILYYPFVERAPGEAEDLLAAVAESACVVVTDEFPAFRYPDWVRRAGRRLGARLEHVDSNGVVPLRAAEEVFKTAYAFRRAFQREFRAYLEDTPKADPLRGLRLPRPGSLPRTITERWPTAVPAGRQSGGVPLGRLPIDHGVAPCGVRGGMKAAEKAWRSFLSRKLDRYAELRNEPEENATSGLSPYLHFGHISAHQIVADLIRREEWMPEKAAKKGRGERSGWWGLSAGAESFLDQVIIWRELGFNMSAKVPDYDRYESLPGWATKTLARHAADRREDLYTPAEFEAGATHDALWNAAQQELVTEGRIHNYLRMLWGKKIVEWSRTPQEALDLMIHLNNKYALDGRNPNSYSGIFWCLGRYDRPWGPERPVFGTVRYMSSGNTARKVRVKDYIARYLR